MPSQDDQRLRAVVTPALERLGYDLEDLVVASAGSRSVVRVVIDRDERFGLDDVADVSRDLSATLDADDSLPGAYVLEVSSPGVDRPLTTARHWRRNVGRLVQVDVPGTERFTGRVTSAGDDRAVLDADGTEHEVVYAEVTRARVQVELRPARGTGLLDQDDEHDDDEVELDDIDADDLDDADDTDADDTDADDTDADDTDAPDDDDRKV